MPSTRAQLQLSAKVSKRDLTKGDRRRARLQQLKQQRKARKP